VARHVLCMDPVILFTRIVDRSLSVNATGINRLFPVNRKYLDELMEGAGFKFLYCGSDDGLDYIRSETIPRSKKR
jgi:hypothetical protein